MDSGTGSGKTISEAGTWPGVPLPLGSLPHPPQVASGGWGRDSRPRALGRAKGKRIQCFFVVTGPGGGGLSLFLGGFPGHWLKAHQTPGRMLEDSFLGRLTDSKQMILNTSRHLKTNKGLESRLISLLNSNI